MSVQRLEKYVLGGGLVKIIPISGPIKLESAYNV